VIGRCSPELGRYCVHIAVGCACDAVVGAAAVVVVVVMVVVLGGGRLGE